MLTCFPNYRNSAYLGALLLDLEWIASPGSCGSWAGWQLRQLRRGGWLAHSPGERRPGNTPAYCSHTHTNTLDRPATTQHTRTEEMPAKETLLIQTEAKLIRKDVDNLVNNIKENLKLTQYDGGSVISQLPDYDYPSASDPPTSFKSRSVLSSRPSQRASPYGLLNSKNSVCECDGSGPGGPGGPGRATSWAARKRYPSMSANGKQKQVELEDPLEMLHELIR